MPNYWIGLMPVVLVALRLEWPPPYGSQSRSSFVLPLTVLPIQKMAILARVARGATVELPYQYFVTTERAKGLREQEAAVGHSVSGPCRDARSTPRTVPFMPFRLTRPLPHVG